jgi:hypothetical protein
MLRRDTNSSIHFAHAPVDHHRLVNGQVLATVSIDLMVMMKSSSIRFYHLVWSLIVS